VRVLDLLSSRVRRGVAAVVALVAFVAFAGAPPPEEAKEYAVKAAFLFNFAKFTTWPDEAFAKSDAPFVVGVLGKDPFGETLDTTLKDKKVGTHPVVVERYATLEALGKPHVLFTNEVDEKAVAALVKTLASRSVLLVGDHEGFAAKGGVAGFYLDKSNVRFEMNPAAARRAKLSVSAQLLKLARVVDEH
jgi:hypothetical protein